MRPLAHSSSSEESDEDDDDSFSFTCCRISSTIARCVLRLSFSKRFSTSRFKSQFAFLGAIFSGACGVQGAGVRIRTVPNGGAVRLLRTPEPQTADHASPHLDILLRGRCEELRLGDLVVLNHDLVQLALGKLLVVGLVVAELQFLQAARTA